MFENPASATGYNLIAIPVAAGAFAFAELSLPPALAAALMSLSTIVVAANAQLLRRLDLSRPDVAAAAGRSPIVASSANARRGRRRDGQ
jgi:Cu2+-exporting ATPase